MVEWVDSNHRPLRGDRGRSRPNRNPQYPLYVLRPDILMEHRICRCLFNGDKLLTSGVPFKIFPLRNLSDRNHFPLQPSVIRSSAGAVEQGTGATGARVPPAWLSNLCEQRYGSRDDIVSVKAHLLVAPRFRSHPESRHAGKYRRVGGCLAGNMGS